MTTITISFLNLDDSKLLGSEVSTNIEVRELPHDPATENIFIRKQFSGVTCSFWKVEKISTVDDTTLKTINCEITISPVQNLPKSIAERHSNNGSKLIRGRIMECDFGYFSQDISLGTVPSVTIQNFNGKLPFEMVKRRLVVVVSNKEDPALVVPISKGDKAKDKRTVVQVTSLPTDLVVFNNSVCFAKTAAISYVSGHRLFPLRYVEADGTRVTDVRVEKKLSNEDVVSIKKAVFTAVGGENILKSIATLEAEVEQLKNDITNKNNALDLKDAEITNLTGMLDDYTK